jgi:hypothetical protein
MKPGLSTITVVVIQEGPAIVAGVADENARAGGTKLRIEHPTPSTHP